jgi:aspartyl/asparaginyl beta-hydroxylase (cupin superfamily)
MKMASTTKQPKVWYSSLGGKKEEGLGYYNREDYDWVPKVEENWEVVREEVMAFMKNHEDRITPYFNKSLVSGPKKWKAFSFRFWSWRVRKNAKECPKTMELMQRIPNLVSVSISILEPDTDIHEHRGDTNAIIRCHLPLEVPASLPEVGFEVSGEQRSWEHGKLILFNDAATHRAWNHSDKIRFVMLFDVIRPEFKKKKYRVCTTVLTGLLMQMYMQKVGFLNKLPRIMLAPLYFPTLVAVYVMVRVRNF